MLLFLALLVLSLLHLGSNRRRMRIEKPVNGCDKIDEGLLVRTSVPRRQIGSMDPAEAKWWLDGVNHDWEQTLPRQRAICFFTHPARFH